MSGLFRELRIGDLAIEIPILQGGMGVRVSSSSLVSAVSNEGGLGVIAAVGLGEVDACSELDFKQCSRDAFVRVVRRTRELTAKPFGVNIMCALSNYEDLVDAAQKESVPVIISGAGLPLRLPSLISNSSTKLIPIVSSARATQIICSVWLRRYRRLPDAVIVEGPLAGGHLGYSLAELADSHNFNLGKILREVLEVVRGFESRGSIPVIAAGGVFDGEDIAGMFSLGASGVQMGTRFVCTHECDVAQAYKDTFVAAEKEDIVVIQSPVGMPGRVVNNDFVKKINSGERVDFGCSYHCLSTCDPSKVNYCIAKALINASRGEMDKGFAMCGSNAFRIKKIVSVKDLMSELTSDACRYLDAYEKGRFLLNHS
ncbi:MAG: nitronate monooxygenase family protein [Candidatus Omnitrophica bacterium]|nr:nitronate monooxygenase family protein [Candidatus Omnitrophota bacterium]